MKLFEVLMTEANLSNGTEQQRTDDLPFDPPTDSAASLKYGSRAEIDQWASKYKFVVSKPVTWWGSDKRVVQIGKQDRIVTMLTDVPANLNKQQAQAIINTLVPATDERDVLYRLLTYIKDDAELNRMIAYGQPLPNDPTKFPVIVTTFLSWARAALEYYRNARRERSADTEDEDGDDFDDHDAEEKYQ